MKIISGKLKGKNLITHKEAKYRPATSMLKEAIFSILGSGKFINPNSGLSILRDAVILDMFGGAGNLAFEAISRGAEKVIIIEKNQLHVDLLNRNVRNLGVEDQATVIKGDALNLPTPAIETKCSIVFIDPPFNAKLVEPSIESLLNKKYYLYRYIQLVRPTLHIYLI